MENKELVWLPKELAKKIQAINDPTSKLCEELIDKYLDDSRREVKSNLEALEEDVLSYRVLMVRAKNAFKEAKEEQIASSYDLWEKFEEEAPLIKDKVDTVIKELRPLKEDLHDIKELLSGINMIGIERLLEVVRAISGHVDSEGNTGKMLKFLFENYREVGK